MQAEGPFRARFSTSPSTSVDSPAAGEARFTVYPGPHKRIEMPEPGSIHRLLLDHIGTGRRVLEFGCGVGTMSRIMNDLGCQVTGVEIDASAAAVAASFCEDIVVADIDGLVLADRFAAGSYDVVVFGEVLEHLRNPWRVLDEARALLAPGGFIVLSVPNVAHGAIRLTLLEGTFPSRSDGLLDDAHLRFFTLRSLREMCLTAGYRIDSIARTKLALFGESDALPAVRENRFSPDVIAKIAADPEHDTFAFVVRATPIPEERRFAYAVGEFFAMERERDEARVALEEFKSSMAADIEKAIAESSGTSEAVDKLESALRSARTRIKELESSLTLAKTESKDLRAEYTAAIDKFLAYAESELFAARTRARELDSAIAAIVKSPFWFPKRLIQKLRRR